MSDAPKELWEVIGAYLEAERIELDDLELLGGQSRKILRATVDSSGGVDLDTISEITAGISRLLDEHDVIAGGYDLEVSTPGLERKLRRPEHFRKVVGQLITVRSRGPIEGERRHEGVLVTVNDEDFEMNIDGVSRSIAYDQVISARSVFVWLKPTKPGKK